MPAKRSFIVGYGNSLRGDDGVGQEVAEALWLQRDRVAELAGATIIRAHQLAPEMAFDVSESSLAVFLDAACDGRPAGSVVLQVLEVPATAPPGSRPPGAGCWEDITPAGLLALALELYGSAPPGVLVTVGAMSVEPATFLSPVVQAAVPRAAAAARLAIASAGCFSARMATTAGRAAARELTKTIPQ